MRCPWEETPSLAEPTAPARDCLADGDRPGPAESPLSHEKIGDMLQAQGDLSGALAEYRTELALMEALLTRNPSHPDWQRVISVAHEKIGDLLQAQGDLSGARRAY